MKRLMEEYDNYALSISVTTRDPRPGEEDGVSYFFRTEEEKKRLAPCRCLRRGFHRR